MSQPLGWPKVLILGSGWGSRKLVDVPPPVCHPVSQPIAYQAESPSCCPFLFFTCFLWTFLSLASPCFPWKARDKNMVWSAAAKSHGCRESSGYCNSIPDGSPEMSIIEKEFTCSLPPLLPMFGHIWLVWIHDAHTLSSLPILKTYWWYRRQDKVYEGTGKWVHVDSHVDAGNIEGRRNLSTSKLGF